MKVAFRADASFTIGSGHVMRCLSLAVELRRRGHTCIFVSRDHPGNLIDFVRHQGFAVAVLHGTGPIHETDTAIAHSRWLGVSCRQDAAQTGQALASHGAPVDWLVVDHYAIGSEWHRAMRGHCRNVLVIDDLADRSFDADLLLDQNLGSTPSHYKDLGNRDCRVITGPRFALLRPEFAKWRAYSLRRRRAPALRQLLISMGGVDQANVTAQVLRSLTSDSLPPTCSITVVLGRQAPWKANIAELVAKLRWKMELLYGAGNMAEKLANTDLVVGAAGTSAWERCALGVPTIISVLAPNQERIAMALEGAGAATPLEVPVSTDALSRAIATTSRHLADMGHASQLITDGRGTSRVVEVMYKVGRR